MRVGLVLLLLLLVAGAIEGFRYYQVYEDLMSARALMTEAQDLMLQQGIEASSDEIASVQSDLAGAEAKLARARRTIESDPALALLAKVPWFSGQVRSTRALLDMGLDAAVMGGELARAVATFQASRDSADGTLPEKVIPVLEAVAPHVALVERRMGQAEARRSDVLDEGLLPPLASARDAIDRAVTEAGEQVDQFRRAERALPLVLGYDEPQTYLVLGLDNTEMLGAGGFVLVYGLMTFDQGVLNRVEFHNVASLQTAWPPPPEAFIEPPRALQDHLLGDWPMGLAEGSWWTDFPTTARNSIDIYHANGGRERIDGVIAINFHTLEKLLEVTGPVTVPEYGETVSSGDVTEKTLIMTHPERLKPWESHRYDFVGHLAAEIIDKSLSAPPSQWQSLITAFRALGREKNLLLYHTDPSTQREIEEFGWDGSLRRDDGDYLAVIDSSMRSTKLNLVVQSSIDLQVKLDNRGNAENKVTIIYANPYSAWAKGKDRRLVDLTTGKGSLTVYGNYLRVLAAECATLEEVAEDGVPVGPESVEEEGGKSVFSRYLLLPLDTRKAISFTYRLDGAASGKGDEKVYRLVVQKQPGTAAVPLAVSVSLRDGGEIRSVSLDGKELGDRTGRVLTDLRQDREIVVRFATEARR